MSLDTNSVSMDPAAKRTRSAYIWTVLCKTPFWTLYGLLVFILYKDLHASHLQVAVFLALKPVVSIFSVYWSSFVNKRRDRLVPNIIVGSILGYLPFFFFPFIDNPWFFIASGALYMMLTRGIIPAWMEILKINIAARSREKVFAYGSAVSYVGGIVLPIFMGDLLDISPGIWRWLFPGCGLLGLASILFQLRIPIPKLKNPEKEEFSLQKQLVQPWKNAWKLCRSRADFFQFQMGFFLGGMGLMIMQPALPQFFFDTLNISYTELAVALSACKGIGFVVTTRFWSALINKLNLFRFSSYVTIIAALFPLFLLCAKYQLFWLYFSYLSYGIMQAGSELSWHLSGPIFAKQEDSSTFSSVNLAMVGLRGCIAPFLGSLLCSQTSSMVVLLLGSLLCFAATAQMHRFGKRSTISAQT